MGLRRCCSTLTLTVAFVLLLPPIARPQGLGAREGGTALHGTNLTYYQRPSLDACQADCANNPSCQGFTWIQAGTYNAADPAMCYLMAAVTGRAPARGHISAVKGRAGVPGPVPGPTAPGDLSPSDLGRI
jgi:hypothetical protein